MADILLAGNISKTALKALFLSMYFPGDLEIHKSLRHILPPKTHLHSHCCLCIPAEVYCLAVGRFTALKAQGGGMRRQGLIVPC
jgi:hypothetical protein